MKQAKTVWAFDLGKASIGEAVRDIETNDFLHKASLLIPAEFASTKSATTRRRMWRTRQAHKARERWLDTIWKEAGQEPLQRRETWKNPKTGQWELKHPGDERLSREFPKKGEETCYTSSLLRIKLLRGDKLEPWQIYKALNSAIQRRGYDPDIPWKARESGRRKKEDEEGETLKAMHEFEAKLEEMTPFEEYQLPCYFDAWKMGLWNPEKPDKLKIRIDNNADPTRNQIVPRKLVEKEIRMLVEAAAKQIPSLKDKAEFVLWGPAKKAYASYEIKTRREYGLREGGDSDWKGVVGQKLPRFDNRIIEKCALIPRLNVCKIKTDKGNPTKESQIIFEATFLMKLKNMRVQRSTIEQSGLTAAEIETIFEDPKRKTFKITETQWEKYCAQFGAQPLPGYKEVDAPRTGGRSSFCRPALHILKRLILSGENPSEFYESEIKHLKGNTDPKRGLVPDDLKFLLKMGDSWDKIHIPNQRLEAILQQSENEDAAIRRIIGSQTDPIVRHRLEIFAKRLRELHSTYGEPENIVLEFIREDFMGEKALHKYLRDQKIQENKRKAAREDAATVGHTERGADLKMLLLREQGGQCLYSGQNLQAVNPAEYHIDHIVPRAMGGPDAAFNYVLTTREENDKKKKQTPFQWLSKTEGWDAYTNRVKGKEGTLGAKKVKLLTHEDASELAQKQTALVETAWIAKLSQSIINVLFGWDSSSDKDGKRRITIVNGRLTARLRRKYKLNSILNPDAENEEEAEKKNRSDSRHHALDAMVISFIPQWTRDAQKEHFFRLPENIHRETFAKHIAEVTPQNICLEKPVLAETIYGARENGSGKIIVQRAELKGLAFKPTTPSKSVYDLGYALKQFKAIRDPQIQEILTNFIADEPTEEEWNKFCDNLRIPRKDGSPGSRIKHVLMNVGSAEEYKDFSKDGTGAWRKAKKGHKGQIVYRDDKGKVRVRPVYAFESLYNVKINLFKNGISDLVFFQSGCPVSLSAPIQHNKTPLVSGVYILSTIFADGRARLTSQSGVLSLPISLDKLLTAGLKRLN